MKYEMEVVDAISLQEKMDDRAVAGWKLISAITHPTQTFAEEPKYILFWEQNAVL